MNILYLSCHSILEFQELSILHELGHNVFSLQGSYQNPQSPGDPKRPALDIPFNQHLNDIALQCSKDKIHDEILDWADIIITMHRLDWLQSNWGKIREKGVKPVWRSIGQSIEQWEQMATFMRPEGLKIVRYSPREQYIPKYAGKDAMIRFGVNPKEYQGWIGGDNRVHVYGQSIKSRGEFLNYGMIDEVTKDFPRVMYGPGNEDCDWSGGVLEFNAMIENYRHANLAVYAGTVPASYTLTFIEMLTVGTPMVCFRSQLQGTNRVFPGQDTYEIPYLIKNGYNGFVSDNPEELKQSIKKLMGSHNLRAEISHNARNSAIQTFNRQITMGGWKNFLNSL